MEINYDKEYLEKQGGWFSYDANRPIRKSLTHRVSLLKENGSITSIAFGSGAHLTKHRKLFSRIYGYDINPAAVQDASEMGFSVKVQDVCVPNFELAFSRTDIVTCFYLYEHIKDHQVVDVTANMMRISDVHIIKLTTEDDPQYIKDTTHINPKLGKAWSKFLRTIYYAYQWKCIAAHFGREWCFVSKSKYNKILEAQKIMSWAVDDIWK
jgi:hypothetical protein